MISIGVSGCGSGLIGSTVTISGIDGDETVGEEEVSQRERSLTQSTSTGMPFGSFSVPPLRCHISQFFQGAGIAGVAIYEAIHNL